MTDSSTSGWYPDPEGRTGLERWWNGLGWSESVRAVPGSGATLTAQDIEPSRNLDPYVSNGAYGDDSAPSQQSWTSPTGSAVSSAPEADQPHPARANGRSGAGTAWIGWVAGAVAVALLITVVVFVGGPNEDPPTSTVGQQSAPVTRPPGQTRIIDEEAGVAYPYLGVYWLEFVGEVAETTSTAGQYIVTQEVVPTGGQFIAQVTSGPLQPIFGYGGPGTFASTIVGVQESVRLNYYPSPNTIETLRNEAITVDGATAYLLEFDLKWDVPGYDSTGERAALILIETGRSAPALMYISIPNTHAELYGIVDRVIREIDVLN